MSTITAHAENEQQAATIKAFLKALKIKFTESNEKTYNPEFVEKIKESKKQVKEGKTTRVDKKDLQKFLGL